MSTSSITPPSPTHTTPRVRAAILPPGPPPLPLLGNIPQFRRDQLAFVRGVQRSYGDIATIYLGRLPLVLFSRPEYVRYFLTENPRNFTNREFAFSLRSLLGDGLLTTDGDFHRQQRRLVQPAFHKKRVESYATVMVEHTQQLLDEWRPNQRLDIANAMQQLTLRIVAKALFNVDLHRDSAGLGHAFTDVIENPVGQPLSLRGLPLDLPFTPYGKHMAARAKLNTYVYTLIAQRRRDGRDVGDVVSMLLASQDDETSGPDASVHLTDKQVRDQTMTLFAAGHETTANALAWTFYLLSQHPAPRARLLAELRQTLGARPPTLDDLPHLPYLDWVISESMRMYPPAWTQGRRAVVAFELGGYSFPAGTMAMFSQWVLHYHPDVWGDPDTFRPERWDPASARKIPQGAYFPFGGGPRMCIGMPFAQLEARLLLATILQRYIPLVVPGAHVTPQPRVTLRPRHGIPVTLTDAAHAAALAPTAASASRLTPHERAAPIQ